MKKISVSLALLCACAAGVLAAETAAAYSKKTGWREFAKIAAAAESGEIELTGKFIDDFPVFRARWKTGAMTDAAYFDYAAEAFHGAGENHYSATTLLRYIAVEANSAEVRAAACAKLADAAKSATALQRDHAAAALSTVYMHEGNLAAAFELAAAGRAERTVLGVASDRLLAAGTDPRAVFTGVYRGLIASYHRLDADDFDRAVRVLCKAATAAGAADTELYAALVQVDRVYCDRAVGSKDNASVKRWGTAIGKMRERMSKYKP